MERLKRGGVRLHEDIPGGPGNPLCPRVPMPGLPRSPFSPGNPRMLWVNAL